MANLRADLPLHVAAGVGAAFGAAAVHAIPAGAVQTWIAMLALISGLHALLAAARAVPRRPWPSRSALAAIGLAVGFGSGLSGTGGPILLLPILLLLGQPLPRSVETALVLQIPIALASTLTHALAGALDLRLGIAIGTGLGIGVWLGRRAVTRLDARAVRRVTGVVLIATGLAYVFA